VGAIETGGAAEVDVAWERWRIGPSSAVPGASVRVHDDDNRLDGLASIDGGWALIGPTAAALRRACGPDLRAVRVGPARLAGLAHA
jgi:hypothetical protein